jgi:hypothetical protein
MNLSAEGHNMPSVREIQQLNSELAKQINQEARANPQSPYAGKFVGIGNGQVVVVADDLGDLDRRLRQIEPDPRKTFCLEASADYDKVEYIWGACLWPT